MKQALIFTLKVWPTAMCLAFIGMWETHVYTGLVHEDYYFAMILGTTIKLSIISLAFAIPFFLTVCVLLTMQWTKVTLKSVLSVLTFGLGWLPFIFFIILAGYSKPFSYEVKRSIIVYILLNCACIWFYKLEWQTKHDRIIPSDSHQV
jgi:hypothetical protein